MAILFGFEIKRPKQEEEQKRVESFAPKLDDDGALMVAAGGSYGTYVDLDGTVKTETDLITKYRDMSLHPEIDAGIDEIVNEAIVAEDIDDTVEIMLDDVEMIKDNEKIKEVITAEFRKILSLLEFETKSYDVFRRWYIDGRLYYHVIIDPTMPLSGIKELRYLDPRKTRKVKEVQRKRERTNPAAAPIQKIAAEYYIYNESGLAQKRQSSAVQTTAIKIAKDAIVLATSGLTDPTGSMILSYLHKSIKALNQLRAMEDAVVIYRLSRAPERRIFYIDVGNLPKMKAEQYLREMMNKHKNKLVYDASTGEMRDDRKFMTMLEDYWLPRREGGKGTEITTLPAGENLGQMADVEYFLKKLYKSMNVPISRMDPESVYSVGRAMEITRDEVKFQKFIDRIRLKFSDLFTKLLEKQLILKNIVLAEDWDNMFRQIKYRFIRDNHFAELQENDMYTARHQLLDMMVPYAGAYYSHEWLRKNIIRQSEEDIEEMDIQIASEQNNPQYEKLAGMSPGGGMGGMMDPSMGGDPNAPPGMDGGDPNAPPPTGDDQGDPPSEGAPPGQKKPPPK